MTDTTYKLIPSHGGYKNLESYKAAVIIFDGTFSFCNKYKTHLTYKTYEQMTGAARSGKQNIAEGSMDSGTSKKTELKLIGIARGSFEELLEDFKDFLRQMKLQIWEKNDPHCLAIRKIAYTSNKSYETYKIYIENKSAEVAANCLICLINQVNFLLDRLLKRLEADFLKNGGFTERMFASRSMYKSYKSH